MKSNNTILLPEIPAGSKIPAEKQNPTVKKYAFQGTFAMQSGSLENPTIAFETWGERNAADDNSVLMFTGLSPNTHVACSPEDPSSGWWEDMVGPGKPIDTNRFHLICVNSLGSCFGSTGPASKNPATGELYRLSFPKLTVEDIAKCGAYLLNHLKIDQLHSVIGASMGGMTALAFCLGFPERVRALCAISSAPRSLPFSIALRSLQRELIRTDPLWLNGEYSNAQTPDSGMRLARKLGMITYRSAAEWSQRFGRERTSGRDHTGPFGMDFEVESYLEAHANKFIGSFDANCYLYLSQAMDLFDMCDYGGSCEAAGLRLELERATIIGADSDFLFPPEQQKELAEELEPHVKTVTYLPLESIQGHDSFLVDMGRFRPAVASFFS